MKYKINIDEKSYEVVIDDINKRPIVAHVNGVEFLVNPEPDLLEIGTAGELLAPLDLEIPGNSSMQDGVLLAPLPGTIVEVFVKPGDTVKTGQVILIIEAMKMKNSIRSTKNGILARVLVNAGETVSHKQVLVEFEV